MIFFPAIFGFGLLSGFGGEVESKRKK